MNFNKHVLTSLLVFCVSASAKEAVDFTTPYINPKRDCMTEGMINPQGKEYRYLYSRDCKVVHVLPPELMRQNIIGQGMNLAACEGLESSRRSIKTQNQLIEEANARLLRYEQKLEKAKSRVEREAIEKDIARLRERIKGYTEVLRDSEAYLQKYYGSTPGAKFSILLGGNITQNEINHIRALNHANLNRKKTIIDRVRLPDGTEKVEEREVWEMSALRPATIDQSIFSFIYNVPGDEGPNGGLIKTDIPGLEYLGQKDATYKGVMHVKANGLVSGQVVMALTVACGHTKKDADGKLVLKENTDPMFTVNRTFTVQQMYAYGYTARLNVDKVVEQITTFVSTDTDRGFKKSVVFNPILKASVDELVSFEWHREFDDGKAESFDKILEIKKAVAADLVDDYLERLEQAGLIKKDLDRPVDPAKGGNVEETKTVHRCWTERDGGLSGLVGRRHVVCGDFPYKVTVWKDGVTEEEVRRSLTLHGETVDTMTVNTVHPFSFTTTFTKKARKGT